MVEARSTPKTLTRLDYVSCLVFGVQEDAQASQARKRAASPHPRGAALSATGPLQYCPAPSAPFAARLEPAPQPEARVEELLQGCGLEEWVAPFARERIDYSTMLELEMSDLVELGMPLGHRKLLLKALRLASSAANQGPPNRALEPPGPQSLESLDPPPQKHLKKIAPRRIFGAAGTEEGGEAQEAQTDVLLHLKHLSLPHTSLGPSSTNDSDAHGWVAGGPGGEAPGETPGEEQTTAEEEQPRSVESAADATLVGGGKGKMSLQEKRVAKKAAEAVKKAAKLATRGDASRHIETPQGSALGRGQEKQATALDAKQQAALDAFSVRQVWSDAVSRC